MGGSRQTSAFTSTRLAIVWFKILQQKADLMRKNAVMYMPAFGEE
jgi:hypothetical protein